MRKLIHSYLGIIFLVWGFFLIFSIASPINWDETLEFFWQYDAGSVAEYLGSASQAICASWFQFVFQGFSYRLIGILSPNPLFQIHVYRAMVLGSLYAFSLILFWKTTKYSLLEFLSLSLLSIVPLLTSKTIGYAILARWYGLSVPILIVWLWTALQFFKSGKRTLWVSFISALLILVSYANIMALAIFLLYFIFTKSRKSIALGFAVILGMGTAVLLDFFVRKILGFFTLGSCFANTFSPTLISLEAIRGAVVGVVIQFVDGYDLWIAIILLIFIFFLRRPMPPRLLRKIWEIPVVLSIYLLFGLVTVSFTGNVGIPSHNFPTIILFGYLLASLVRDLWERRQNFSPIFSLVFFFLLGIHVIYQIANWQNLIDRPSYNAPAIVDSIQSEMESQKQPKIVILGENSAHISLLRAHLLSKFDQKEYPVVINQNDIQNPMSISISLPSIETSEEFGYSLYYLVVGNLDNDSLEEKLLIQHAQPGWHGWGEVWLLRGRE